MTTQASAPQALGHVGIRAKDLGDTILYDRGGYSNFDRQRHEQ
jgi:hypothetical protein